MINLTKAEQKRLSIVIKECGEVARAAYNILWYGYESNNPSTHESNRKELERELEDLSLAILRIRIDVKRLT